MDCGRAEERLGAADPSQCHTSAAGEGVLEKSVFQLWGGGGAGNRAPPKLGGWGFGKRARLTGPLTSDFNLAGAQKIYKH